MIHKIDQQWLWDKVNRATKHKALDMAVQCRPFDAECLESLYEAILAKLEEIDALKDGS